MVSTFGKWVGLMFVVSLPMMIIGYFLQTILIPIQDFNRVSKAEMLNLQKELAINYPVGTFLMYAGLLLCCLSLLCFVGSLVRELYLTIISRFVRK